MSRAGRKTKRKRQPVAQRQPSESFAAILKRRLGASPDSRSHAEFLRDMRTKQAAGRLANSATAALLDRLERAIASQA